MIRLVFFFVGCAALAAQAPSDATRAFAAVLRHVDGDRVNYQALVADRATLERAVTAVANVPASADRAWSRNERLAFWINAYNLFTLAAIADHYPIRGRALSFGPRNSIRQIDGVWTTLTWRAAGRTITLDGIEHGLLRKELQEPMIHFAVNCASISCPPIAAVPYDAARLDAQLDAAARRFLASGEGVQIRGRTLRVSSLFKWYGGDFVERFASRGPAHRRDPVERAILGVVVTYGDAAAAALAGAPDVRLSYLPYDWRLNEAGTGPR